MATKCPKCHSENPDTKQFCGDCGTQLQFSEEIPAPTKTLEIPKEELTTGSTFAERYQIIEELGKGGMGRVYKATDTKINEKVALKLIKPEIASDKKTLERFANELKIARKIVHKNVGRMYDINEENGTHYITMEYVSGQDLKGLIRQTGQLAIGTSISIAKQVCEGLSEAHKTGVTHRDLKPSNIMIDNEGNVRIMDFGIARSLEAKGITGAGIIIGTPEYMSPEQAEAKEVDHRSDIYSLGVIFYEMVTGQLPFEGDTPLSIAMKHKGEIPKDPKALNPQIPEDLNIVILRLLEKDKDKRYQSTEEVRSELTNIERGIPTTERVVPKKKPLTSREITLQFSMKKLLIPSLAIIVLAIIAIVIRQAVHQKRVIPIGANKPSVAVLPFEDLSPQKDQGYLCDGFAESLINALIKVKGLRVPAPTSSFPFRNKDINIREIGEKLNVKAVLRGSVQKAGNRVGIIAQLINVKDETLLWSEQYNREMDDVFTIQEEINLAIVNTLRIELLGGEKEKLVKQYTENSEAYNLYLQGRYFWSKRKEEDIKKAIEYFEQAVEKDPNYAMAFTGLADCYIVLLDYTEIPIKDVEQKIKEAVQKALDIDNTLAEPHASLGALKRYNLDWEGAEKEFKRAIELNPSYATAHLWYAVYLAHMARFDDATKETQRALELDPLSLILNRWMGGLYFYSRQYDKAIKALKKVIEMDSNFPAAHSFLGMAYTQKSMYEEALAEFQKEDSISWRAVTYVRMGRRDEAQDLLEELLRLPKKSKGQLRSIAWIYFALGENDHGFEWLERVSVEHPFMMQSLKIHQLYDSVRTDPRYITLLKKMGFK